MRAPRQRFDSLQYPVGYYHYHCVSRVVNRDFILGDEEKEHLVKLMRGYEALCGVRVITYCMMSNHFHILVEVPQRPAPEALPSDEALVSLLRKARDSYGSVTLGQDLKRFREAGQHAAAEALKERFFRRMWDVSWFIRLIKQRFTQWYNKRRQRTGTLWEDRFKSVLVEGAGRALATMAAYIDLNPVRAGIVADPQDYRWCGLAEASAGRRQAREAFAVVIEALLGQPVAPQRVLAEYRMQVYGRGEERGIHEDSPDSSIAKARPKRRGVSQQRIEQVLESKGTLTRWEALRCRIRYFSDGMVFGSREFVENHFQTNRSRYGPTRTTGARKMRHIDLPGLYTIRDLQKAPIGKTSLRQI